MAPDWSVVFFLPHVRIPEDKRDSSVLTLGLKGIAIVRHDDPRVREYLDWSAAATDVMDRFTTEYGAPHQPSVLIVRRDWLASFRRKAEPIMAFRNAVAMSSVMYHRANDSGWLGPSWTESFDHSPAEVTVDGSRVDILTPAVSSWGVPLENLRLTNDPGLPVREIGFGDDYLAVWLGRAWSRTYRYHQQVRRGRTLFRSLESAYLAASMRARSYGSLNEVGVGAVLWVSGIEILASPDSRDVRRLDGHDLIAAYEWDHQPRLRRRYYKVVESARAGTHRRVNLATLVYDRLYTARSKFVHGDTVRVSLLRPFGATSPPLLALASTVYRAALGTYMSRYWDWTPRLQDMVKFGVFALASYDHHLLSAVGKS